MIKSVYLKVFLQNYVFSAFSVINKIFRHRSDVILLYSNMGFKDNVKAVFDYIIENRLNDKYKILCSINDYDKYKTANYRNVKFISNTKGVLCYFRAGFVFYCFGKIPIEVGKNQKVVQMWHGCPYKAPDEGMLKGHSFKKNYYTYVISSSNHFVPVWSYAFSVPQEKVVVTGIPRNDVLYKNNPHYDFGNYKRLIIWTPTFRQSKTLGYQNVTGSSHLVPVVDISDYARLDAYLKERDVKIIVKLHPMQNLDDYHLIETSNFILLSHADFVRRGMDLYKFLPQCDAMITDYSNIFFDFLLLDRPIGFTEDDLEDYGDKRGFIVDNPQAYKPGMRIKTIEDLFRFIDSVTEGRDDYKADRDRVNGWANDYRDGQFCKRVLDSVGICQ